MYRGNPPRRSPRSGGDPPSTVESLVYGIVFVGAAFGALVAVSHPGLVVALAAGMLTAAALSGAWLRHTDHDARSSNSEATTGAPYEPS
jgi:flavin-dependent dehydrogenase